MRHPENRLFLRRLGIIFRNGALFRNPVLVGALGLYPVAAAGFGLRNAAALCILFTLTALPVQLLLCLLGLVLPRWARPAAVLAAAAVFYLPAARAAEGLLPGSVGALGMAAYLTACNSVLYARACRYAPEHILPAAAADALGYSAGFAGVLLLVSAARQLWLKGGPWGGPAGDGAGLPFAGFLLLGFLAALMQGINLRRSKRYAGEGK
jgi:Na+-translocating ferredoxin:NAD+ oxidoreductase RnfE subunit